MASIDIRGVSKHYVDVSALAKVDLQVADGELCVILGPSGCGKSTLLQVVAGLMQQDDGSIWMDGRCIDHLSPRERDVAMVFQSYALYPHMTVYENMRFGKEGRVRQVGTPEAVYDHPADTFVATFIGSPMMNLFEGTLVREKGRRLFRSEGLSLDLEEMAGGCVPATSSRSSFPSRNSTSSIGGVACRDPGRDDRSPGDEIDRQNLYIQSFQMT